MFGELKKVTAERQAIYDVIDKFNKEILDLENQKTKAEKKIHQKYNKLDMLEKGIKELDRRLQVTSTDHIQEKQIIKEMAFIKESRPYIELNEKLREQIFKKKQEKYEAGKDLGDYKAKLKEIKDKISGLKKSQVDLESNKESIKKQLDKINLERNTIKASIN